jgi:CDP-diacylglycerol--serine O-phosphatidyltransferase
MCTVIALLLGSSAILLAAAGELDWAGVCLLGCFGMDGIDGALARKLGVASPFGAQMDSLADLCGFGVATPLLAYHWLNGAAPDYAIATACAILATCAMIRLARFNVMPKDARYFSGLPAAMPAVILAFAIQLDIGPAVGHMALVVILAVLMVTTFPYAKFGRLYTFPWWVWLISVAVAMMSPTATFELLVAVYLASGPVLWLLKRLPRPAPAAAAESPPVLRESAKASTTEAFSPSLEQHVRIAVIGAGFAGLGMAIRLKQLGMDDFVVLERAGDVGGTWRDNVYPGAACDVPSNLYSYSFAPEPTWTRTFPSQPEIQGYLRRCAAEFGLDRHLRFGQEMLASEWDDDSTRWRVVTSRGCLTADVLVVATGPLSEPATPSVPGLERFAGATFHSAAWEASHDISGRRVAVIGTGASAVQFIPEIQPKVDKLYVFQRTPPWVIPRWNRSKTVLEVGLFRRLPRLQQLARAGVYLWRESLLLGLMFDQRMLKPAEWWARRHLHRQVDDPELRAALTPDYALGCKRLILSSTYFPSITQANAELVTSEIREVRQNSIISADRTERMVDTIIFGTGFESANMPIADRLRGRHSRSLTDAWRDGAEAYLGSAIAGYPNLFMLLGPNSVSGQNSSLLTMEAQVDYVIDAVRFMDEAHVAAVEIRAEVQASFVSDLQRKTAGTVWTSGCRSWYLDSHGRNTTLWPGFTRAFCQRTRRFDHENYLLRARSPRSVDREPPQAS